MVALTGMAHWHTVIHDTILLTLYALNMTSVVGTPKPHPLVLIIFFLAPHVPVTQLRVY